MSSKCNRCNAEIIWGPYVKDKTTRPLNMDNSVHSCVKPDTPETKSIVKSAVKPQVIEISDIIEEIKLLKSEFGEIECQKFESVMKYAISRMMNRR